MKKIYIEITNSCNLNCEFCHNTNREKAVMTIEQFENIIKQVKEYSNLICLHVKGEPLFYPELDKIFDVLTKYNLKTNITTNGTLLKFRSEVLENSKCLRQLNISLHSSVENQNINIEEYMKRIFEVVEKLEKNGVIISYRLWNLSDYKENDKNNEIIKLLEERYKLEKLKSQLAEKEWIKISEKMFINQDVEFVWPCLNEEILNETGRCLALKDQFGVLVNGDVVPCCIDSEGDIKLGNIFEQNIEDILNSDRAVKMVEGFKNNIICEHLCKRCGFLKRLEEKRK